MPTSPFRAEEGVWVERLRIHNFRAIEDLELAFQHRLTLLIGENGAGKTTILDALAAVLQDTRPLRPVLSSTDCHRAPGKPPAEATLESAQCGIPIRQRIKPDVPHSIARSAAEYEGDTRGGYGTVKAYFGAERSHGEAFSELVRWFAAKDIEELRQIREAGNSQHRDPELSEVRRVVSALIPSTDNVRIAPSGRLVVDQIVAGKAETFGIDELAGGLRAMLVLVADLARMIIVAKGAQKEPVFSLALIDEVDLHLHPKWQLEVMNNLLAAFPETQFIATTHSEEIIASVPSECIIALRRSDSGVTASTIPPVEGATFDRVLEDAMGLPSRRPLAIQRRLDEYWRYVDAGQADLPDAIALRASLDELFKGNEPDLVRADLVIKRKRALGSRGRPTT
jgi:predicted ATP-binding protein involved in virulence